MDHQADWMAAKTGPARFRRCQRPAASMDLSIGFCDRHRESGESSVVPPIPTNGVSSEHALQYLARADGVPHRGEGEALLLEFIPMDVERILDLGTGDGRLLAFLCTEWPNAEGVGLDVSPAMLRAARERFRDDGKVQVLQHDLEEPLPDLGRFDAIISSFAFHHVSDMRKNALYSQIHAALCPGGVFCNL